MALDFPNPDFYALLQCPMSAQPITVLDDTRLDKLNAMVAAGDIKTMAGDVVDKPVENALLRKDRKVAYPSYGGVFLMNAHDALDLSDVKLGRASKKST